MRYEAPASIDEAVSLLAGGAAGARVLAGGTDLLVQMRTGRLEPGLVVDIKRVPGMLDIQQQAGGYSIGAAVPGAQLNEHEALSKAWPGVTEAAGLIGSDQVQSRASMGGNLCNASPAADSVPALVAADARAVIVGPSGRRELPVADVVIGPGKTALQAGELVESILLPARPPGSADAYLRFIPRTEMDIAVVGVAVNLTLDTSGVCTAARVALGAVAERVLLVEEAGAALVGSTLDDDDLERLAAACSAACRPIDDKRGTIEFRTNISGVLAKRAAKTAHDRARRT